MTTNYINIFTEKIRKEIDFIVNLTGNSIKEISIPNDYSDLKHDNIGKPIHKGCYIYIPPRYCNVIVKVQFNNNGNYKDLPPEKIRINVDTKDVFENGFNTFSDFLDILIKELKNIYKIA